MKSQVRVSSSAAVSRSFWPVRAASAGGGWLGSQAGRGIDVCPGSAVAGLLLGAGGAQPVGVGAGFDDVAAEGEPVDDGGAEAGVGEGLGPAAEAFVGGDRDAVFLLAFGEDLEQ